MPPVRARSPLTLFVVIFTALVSWTCSSTAPSLQADRSTASASREGVETTEAEVFSATVVRPPEPRRPRTPIEAFEPIDDGVPGLRIPIHDPSGRAMHALHDGLERAQRGEGQARLLFYGASHVASDWFTNVIRKNLQERFGDAGHGFVLPVHPWRSYRHLGVRIESDGPERWTTHRIRTGNLAIDRYGLAGVAVETSEAGAFGIVETDDRGTIGRLASRFELFYLRQPDGGTFEVLLDGDPRAVLSTAGDEPEAAYVTYSLADGPHRFEVRARGDGPVRLFGVAVERDEPGVILDTLGINGSRARYHLSWEDVIYREHLARREPDLVVLAYGTNESGDDDVPIANYAAKVRRVLTRIRETVPGASCLLIGPSDRPIRDRRGRRIRDRPRTLDLVAAQRQLAEEFGCGFFDLVAFMGGPMSMVEWVRQGFAARDHIHLTRGGYERLGEVLFHALVYGYPDLPDPRAAVQ